MSRLAELTKKCAIYEHDLDNYKMELERAVENFIQSIDSISDTARNFIIGVDSRFVDKSFIESIKDMSYDEVQEVSSALRNLLNKLYDEAERGLKCV